MTFGVIPGLCLVAYAFECGNRWSKFRVDGYLQALKETNSAREKAIKSTGELFFPWKPAVGALLISGILFFLSGDFVMLVVINLVAIPVALFSYYQGVKLCKAKGVVTLDRDDSEFEAQYHLIVRAVLPYGIRIVLLWLLLAGTLLAVAYLLDLWKPH